MHRKIFKLIASLLIIWSALLFVTTPVFAEETIVETTFFGNIKDDGKGCSVFTILDLVLQVLTPAVGIAAVVGISIVGVQYLTAGGNETRVAKAKSRLLNIVIGIIAYAVLYSVLGFILPNFNPNLKPCEKATDTELAEYKAKEEAKRKESANQANSSTGSSSKTTKQSNATKQQQIASVAAKLAKGGSPDSPSAAFKKAFQSSGVGAIESGNGDSCHRDGKSCGSFAATVLVSAGVLNISTVRKKNLVYAQTLRDYFISSPNWKRVTKPQAGDIGLQKYPSTWHIYVFTKDGGKLRVAEGNHCLYYGMIKDRYNSAGEEIYRYVGG